VVKSPYWRNYPRSDTELYERKFCVIIFFFVSFSHLSRLRKHNPGSIWSYRKTDYVMCEYRWNTENILWTNCTFVLWDICCLPVIVMWQNVSDESKTSHSKRPSLHHCSVRRFKRWCKTAANPHCKNWSSSRVVLRKVLELRTRKQSRDCITSELIPEKSHVKHLSTSWIELHNGEFHNLYC